MGEIFRPRWSWACALVGVLSAQACEREGTGDLRINATCRDYCKQATACDDSVDVDDCRDDCEATMGDCQADEQENALDDLDNCATDSCSEFGACTIGAGLQCTFGI